MPTRLRYPEVAPAGYAALSSFGHYINTETALEPTLIGFVYLRASQINGCEFCIAAHEHELRKHNEPQSRIDAVASWRASDAFTPRERAALAWTEVITQVAATPASDADYAAVTEFFQGKDLVDLTYAIANINAWNRLGVAFKPKWNPQKHAEDKAKEPLRNTQQSAVDDDGGKVAQE